MQFRLISPLNVTGIWVYWKGSKHSRKLRINIIFEDLLLPYLETNWGPRLLKLHFECSIGRKFQQHWDKVLYSTNMTICARPNFIKTLPRSFLKDILKWALKLRNALSPSIFQLQSLVTFFSFLESNFQCTFFPSWQWT